MTTTLRASILALLLLLSTCCLWTCSADGGVPPPPPQVILLDATLLSATPEADPSSCDAPDVFSARIAVFYGVPSLRIVASSPFPANAALPTTPPSCNIQFYFANATDADYYSNEQLTALLLALDNSFRERFLLIANLMVAGGSAPPPPIDPAPRPPTVPPVQPPVKIFQAVFSSTAACDAFVRVGGGAQILLQVSADRLVWANGHCAPFEASDAAVAVFSIADANATMTHTTGHRRSHDDAIGGVVDASSAAVPMRMAVENAIVDGLPQQALEALNLTSLSFVSGGGAVSVPVTGFSTRMPTVLLAPASTAATADPGAFVSTLSAVFGIVPSSLRVVWTSTAMAGGGALMLSAASTDGATLVDCLLNVSASTGGSNPPGDSGDLIRVVLGVSFAVAALLAVAAVVIARQRQLKRRRGRGGAAAGQYASADAFDGGGALSTANSSLANTRGPSSTTAAAVNMEKCHHARGGGIPNNANTVLLS